MSVKSETTTHLTRTRDCILNRLKFILYLGIDNILLCPDRTDPGGGSWIPNCNLIVRLLDRDSMQINLEYVLNLINPSGFISTVFSILSDAALPDHQFWKISETNTALESDQWWSNPEKMTLLTEFGCKFPHIFLVSSITIALTVNFASPKFIAFTRVLIKYIYTCMAYDS